MNQQRNMQHHTCTNNLSHLIFAFPLYGNALSIYPLILCTRNCKSKYCLNQIVINYMFLINYMQKILLEMTSLSLFIYILYNTWFAHYNAVKYLNITIHIVHKTFYILEEIIHNFWKNLGRRNVLMIYVS